MSLEVSLRTPGVSRVVPASSGIFVREDGATREISVEEWNAKHPGMPAVQEADRDVSFETDEVFGANITHNLNGMAEAAGLYPCLWRPAEIGIRTASDLIKPLGIGLRKLIDDPDTFKKFNPTNGWGNYDALVKFVARYLAACIENPTAIVSVNR